jgi:hypothetical protein
MALEPVNPCNAIESRQHFGQGGAVYQPQQVDRMMPTITQYYRPAESYASGMTTYDNGPLPLVGVNYGGRFATADLPRIIMPPGWEQIQK